MLQSVCVFCGSRSGSGDVYRKAALTLADEIVRRRLRLIYGGGDIGLMGILADRVLELGGEVEGVIPLDLVQKEVAHHGVSHLHIVSSMHERKALMADLSDAFIALPGGFGTLEEWFEVITWKQLGIHHAPCGLLNVHGYFDNLLSLLDHFVNEQFLKPDHRALMIVRSDAGELLDQLFADFERSHEQNSLPERLR